jgi:tetratricopeptide (TPR) repeat protein
MKPWISSRAIWKRKKTMNRILPILIISLSLGLFGSGYAAVPDAAPADTTVQDAKETQAPIQVDQTNFFKGYELFKDQNYEKACPYFYEYISAYSPDAADYEWAEFFLGVSLKKLRFSQAAADILARLVSRKPNPKIVEYSMEIFETMSRTQAFDNDLIITQTVCDQEFGYADGNLSAFINYHQGVYDWEHGFIPWGDDHFAKIKPGTYYYYKFLNQKALLKIYNNRIDEAVPLLNQILSSSCTDELLKDDVRKTLARLLYEQGKFKESDLLYETIEQNILAQSQNLLERAWAHYRMGNPEKAMGLLYAFEAPSFRNYLTPEYYMLKSFIYKDVCHYQSAMGVVDEFKGHYGKALSGIYQRSKISENNELLLLILNKKNIRQTWDFLQLLENERALCSEFRKEGSDAFYGYLDKIYVYQIEESTSSLKIQIESEYEKYADALLQYEEEAHMMAYEIGLDMYQRVNQYHYADEQKLVKGTSERIVVYPFQGEFWNDELADLKVVLPNKCKNLEEWDIFFK